MTHYIVASHGKFAYGVVDTLKILLGEQENIEYICAYSEQANESIEDKVKEVIDNIKEGEEVIVLTDLLGGSLTNEFVKYMNESIHIVAGINILLIIEILLGNKDIPVNELIKESLDRAKDGMAYLNDYKNEEFQLKLERGE